MKGFIFGTFVWILGCLLLQEVLHMANAWQLFLGWMLGLACKVARVVANDAV